MAAPDLSNDAVTRLARLSNRAATLAFASALAIFLALIALSGVLREGDPIRRLAAVAASILAVAVTAWARRGRAELRAARARLSGSPGPFEAGSERVAASPAATAPRGRRAHPRNA